MKHHRIQLEYSTPGFFCLLFTTGSGVKFRGLISEQKFRRIAAELTIAAEQYLDSLSSNNGQPTLSACLAFAGATKTQTDIFLKAIDEVPSFEIVGRDVSQYGALGNQLKRLVINSENHKNQLFVIINSIFHFPFDLLYFGEGLEKGIRVIHFLGYTFSTVYWTSTVEFSSAKKEDDYWLPRGSNICCVINPSLKFSDSEYAGIKQTLEGFVTALPWHRGHFKDEQEVVDFLARDVKDRMCHISSHSNYNNSVLRLEVQTSLYLNPSNLLQNSGKATHRRKFYFANLCSGVSANASKDCFALHDSLYPDLATGILTTHCKISEGAAGAFSRSFYEHLVSKKIVTDAFFYAKSELLESDENILNIYNFTGLCYCLFSVLPNLSLSDAQPRIGNQRLVAQVN